MTDEKRDEIDKINEIDEKECKNKNNCSPQKRAMNCCIQTLPQTYKNEKNNVFWQTKKVFKKQRYLNLNSVNNRNAITKRRFPSNFVINNTKWLMSRKVFKIAKIKRENKRKWKLYDNFSCDKYDNIHRKALNDVNEVDNTNFKARNNRKTKTFLNQRFFFFSLDSFCNSLGIEETFRGNNKKLGTLVMYVYIFNLVYFYGTPMDL